MHDPMGMTALTFLGFGVINTMALVFDKPRPRWGWLVICTLMSVVSWWVA